MNVGQTIPDFTGDSQVGEIDLHEYIDGGWAVIFTIPNFFDPVHTTVREGSLLAGLPPPIRHARHARHAHNTCAPIPWYPPPTGVRHALEAV